MDCTDATAAPGCSSSFQSVGPRQLRMREQPPKMVPWSKLFWVAVEGVLDGRSPKSTKCVPCSLLSKRRYASLQVNNQ